jgi:adenosine kinase
LGERPILLGSVGSDASRYVNKLKDLGIDIKHIHQSAKKTASYTVLTDVDDNQIGGFYPGAMFDSDSLSFARWKRKDVFIVLSPHDPKAMRRQVEECRKFSFRLFYDVSQQVNNIDAEDIAKALTCTELLILNDYEFRVLCEKTKMQPDQVYTAIPVVVVTKGKKGSEICGQIVKKRIEVSSVAIKSFVDPTGAGDAYRAGFLYGYIRSLPLKVCAQLGSITAAYAIEKQGTQEHVFKRDEFIKRYKQNYQEDFVF